MKNIVVLGAGTGGALISNLLTQHLDLDDWKITVIDRSAEHVYQPGLLFIPFGMYGYNSGADISRDILDPMPQNASFVGADVKLIDHEKKVVETDKGKYSYDFLVSALGCHLDTEGVEGLAETLGTNNVHTFYTVESAMKLQGALDKFKEGRLVIDICDMPIKCPVAPLEFAFLADYYFHKKGMRDRVEISVVTPYAGAFTKPNANRVLSKIAEEKNIKVVPNFTASAVNPDRKILSSFDGRDLDYDLLVTIPANVGPEVLDDSELGDGNGYALTDPRTLKSKKADYIYCMGDNTNVATSKAGSVAHFESETVLENLLREMDGKPAEATFDGHANCFIESGFNKALLIDFNYDMEPLEGSFPMPHMGPMSLLKESYMNHVGKLAFKWVYWNMLLSGRLSTVPFLSAHMTFMGKQIDTTPQSRHSHDMHVSDVMTTEVITIKQGSSLSEAAKTLAEKHISGLPVISSENKLVGVLTEADFVAAMDIKPGQIGGFYENVVRKHRPRKHMGTIVDDIMTTQPVTINPDDSLSKAIHLMDKHHIKRLIVSDGHDGVAGVVSRRDLMKMYAMK